MYSFVKLTDIEWQKWIKKPRLMKTSRLKEILQHFYVIRVGEALCKTPIGSPLRTIICYNAEHGKIGTHEDNIPTTLTLESDSDEIQSELERFYKHHAEKS